MSIFSQYQTDRNLEIKGISYEVGETDDGKPITFVLARAGGHNVDWTKAVAKGARGKERKLNPSAVDPVAAKQLILSAFVDSVLLGWSNVTDLDGNEIPFNRENALHLMRELPDLFSELLSVAQDSTAYRVEIRKEQAKN